MATEKIAGADASSADLSAFMDVEPFWVIWQANVPAKGASRIRRINQEYRSEARAEADADRFRKSGTITWVEEARPMSPAHVPAAALDALRGIAPARVREGVTAIGGS
jgi:hypothetical protein